MNLAFTPHGWDDYRAMREGDASAFRKLETVIEECRRNPFKGTGKPEPLKGNLKGWWSRRVTQEHRLIYRVTGSNEAQQLEIAQCRFHY